MKNMLGWMFVLGLGMTTASFASDAVQGTVDTTTQATKDIAHGTKKAAENVGQAAEDLVKGTGKAVDTVGQGIEHLMDNH